MSQFMNGQKVIAFNHLTKELIKGKRICNYVQEDENGTICTTKIRDEAGNYKIFPTEYVFPIYYEQKLNDMLNHYRNLQKKASGVLWGGLADMQKAEKLGRYK